MHHGDIRTEPRQEPRHRRASSIECPTAEPSPHLPMPGGSRGSFHVLFSGKPTREHCLPHAAFTHPALSLAVMGRFLHVLGTEPCDGTLSWKGVCVFPKATSASERGFLVSTAQG
jgi:hypothetical protein